MNRTTLLELMEVRQSLEISIAAIAARKRTTEDLAQLQRIMQDMESSVGDDAEGERTDLAFHELLVQATHNAIMVQTCDSIRNAMEMMIRDIRRAELYANQEVAVQLLKEHKVIYEAIRQRRSGAGIWGDARAFGACGKYFDQIYMITQGASHNSMS